MLDVRTRLRRICRSPAYLIAVVLSLGLGISVTLAALSIANALVFRPLPGVSVRRNLVRVEWTAAARRLTTAEFEAVVLQHVASLTDVAAQGDSRLPVLLPAGPEAVRVAFVSERFFAALGTSPLLGRLLSPGDADAAPVALLGAQVWRRAFNGDPRVVGGALVVGGNAFTIVGVTPERFSGLSIVDVGGSESDYPQVWLRLGEAQRWTTTARTDRPWLAFGGRLPADGSMNTARAELDLAARRIAAATRSRAAPDRSRSSFRSYRAGLDWRDEPGQSLLTMALFLFVPLSVLAIGCVNVINLQLARGMEEAGELSLRLALGASRARILRLLLLEITALTIVCAGLGCAGAHVLLTRVAAYLPARPGIDGTVLVFTVVLVFGVVCVAGLPPAWQTSRDTVVAGLREFHDASLRRVRLRSALVVVQVAVSVALLALAGIAIRSILQRSPGLVAEAGRTLAADFDFTDVRPAVVQSGLFIDSVLEALAHAPSIDAAAFATFAAGAAPIHYSQTADAVEVDRVAYGGSVTPGWFAATGLPFLAGSLPAHFTAEFAVVNRALATALVSGSLNQAIGTRIRVRAGQVVEVAGVVADTERGADGAPLPMLFLPMPSETPPFLSLIVRGSDSNAARQAIHAAVTAADPSIPVARLDTIGERIDARSKGLRALISMAVTVGLVSAALAGAGLHSLLAYTVRRRTREIGIRVALGARAGEIVRLVTVPLLVRVGTGAAAGVAAAVPLAALLRSALLGTASLDLRDLLLSIAVLLGVAVVAAFGPTYHAARVDAMQSLREH